MARQQEKASVATAVLADSVRREDLYLPTANSTDVVPAVRHDTSHPSPIPGSACFTSLTFTYAWRSLFFSRHSSPSHKIHIPLRNALRVTINWPTRSGLHSQRILRSTLVLQPGTNVRLLFRDTIPSSCLPPWEKDQKGSQTSQGPFGNIPQQSY